MPAMSSIESAPVVAPSIQIFVNGVAHTVAAGLSVDDLLGTLGLDPAQVAVERNGEIVPRRQRGSTPLGNGDRFELVTFVGGG